MKRLRENREQSKKKIAEKNLFDTFVWLTSSICAISVIVRIKPIGKVLFSIPLKANQIIWLQQCVSFFSYFSLPSLSCSSCFSCTFTRASKINWENWMKKKTIAHILLIGRQKDLRFHMK